jgi:hypothetical protein
VVWLPKQQGDPWRPATRISAAAFAACVLEGTGHEALASVSKKILRTDDGSCPRWGSERRGFSPPDEASVSDDDRA